MTDTNSAAGLTTPRPEFTYQPISQDVDGLRLFHLAPGKSSPIRGTLIYHTFAEKPKYEALSYTWGDGEPTETIYIDEMPFRVGSNLSSALLRLQDPKEDRCLWIDAICINQLDIPEKNWQIRLMPFIYLRAATVVVWLGIDNGWSDTIVGSAFHALDVVFDASIYLSWLKTKIDSYSARPKTDVMGDSVVPNHWEYERMCKHPYWHRVWIVQELELAKKIRLYYNTGSILFPDFIAQIRSWAYSFGSAPLKFETRLHEKYSQGNKLQTLIETYKESRCKDPRDHIYGFVGLANDCDQSYPIDYNKSLYSVWKDLLQFKNKDKEDDPYDILRFGRDVQDLLGGPDIATVAEAAVDLALYQDLLQIPVRVVGVIAHIGPTYQEVMSSFEKRRSWIADVNRHVPNQQRAAALEENAWFLEVAEEKEEALKTVCRCVQPMYERMYEIGSKETAWGWDHHTIIWPDTQPENPEPHLFVLGEGRGYEDSPGRVGLVPPGSQVGDVVCQIYGIERVVTVRLDTGLFGQAILARNHLRARAAREESSRTLGPGGFATFSPEDLYTLHVTCLTAYWFCRRTSMS